MTLMTGGMATVAGHGHGPVCQLPFRFMIFSAAVIDENPRLFGYDFDNPLTASLPA